MQKSELGGKESDSRADSRPRSGPLTRSSYLSNLGCRNTDTPIATVNIHETRAYAGYTIGFMGGQKQRAMALVEDVTRQCPSFAWARAALALLESYYGDARRAIELAKAALRLSPRDPQSFRCEMAICGAHLRLGQFEACLDFADQGLHPSGTRRRV